MRSVWKWLKRSAVLLLLVLLGLMTPVAYVETLCVGTEEASPYQAILEPRYHRVETRTLMTFPEWQIVHAYEDYAEVIRTGDPHDFRYLNSIGGFWSSLCKLNEASARFGPVDGSTRMMVHVIGLSFTVELLLKSAYENTIGRFAVFIRGHERAPTDELSARQSREYADFLQQVPWYKWRFREASAEIGALLPTGFRDRERQFALGIEYRAKAEYAAAIASAVDATGKDELSLRLIVAPRGILPPADNTRIVGELPQGIVMETPRYRALTRILLDLSLSGHDFVEIAGNDDILISVLSKDPQLLGAIDSEPRQGFGDYRHLMILKVSALAQRLRDLSKIGATLEHIHDY